MTRDYNDIINLPAPTSKTHPRMPMANRAAQFSPFAALTGYDDAVAEERRLTEDRHKLSEEGMAELNERLRYLLAHKAEQPFVRAEYFIEDKKKSGGAYSIKKGNVRNVDPVNGYIEFSDRQRIEFKFLQKIHV